MGYATRHSLAGPLLALLVLAHGLYAQPPVPLMPSAPTAPSPGLGGPGMHSPPGAVPKRSDDVLRFSRNVPGDAKPILIDANEIFTWNEDGKVVLLLKGQVLVQQSVV